MGFEIINEGCIDSLGDITLVDMKIRSGEKSAWFLLRDNMSLDTQVWFLNPETGANKRIGKDGFKSATDCSSFALTRDGFLIGDTNSIRMFDNVGTYVRDFAYDIPSPMRMCWHGETLMVAASDINAGMDYLYMISDQVAIEEFPRIQDVESRQGIPYIHKDSDDSTRLCRQLGGSWSTHISFQPVGYHVDQIRVFPDGRTTPTVLTYEKSLRRDLPDRLCVSKSGNVDPLYTENLDKSTERFMRIDSDGFVYEAVHQGSGMLRLRKMKLRMPTPEGKDDTPF